MKIHISAAPSRAQAAENPLQSTSTRYFSVEETVNNSDKNNLDTPANSTNEKCTSKIAVKQYDKQPPSPVLPFKCDQCENTNNSEQGLRQQVGMKHRISQLDGNEDIKIDNSEYKNNPCPQSLSTSPHKMSIIICIPVITVKA